MDTGGRVDVASSANALLLNLQTILGFVVEGFASAGQSLIGAAVMSPLTEHAGQRNTERLAIGTMPMGLGVLVTGAAGMIGSKLAARLARDGRVGSSQIDALWLTDLVEPDAAVPSEGKAFSWAGDVSNSQVGAAAIARRPDIVFHLAAIPSGGAEADFDAGYRVNMQGMWNLLESVRAEQGRGPYRPKFVFASSIAVFGPPMPAVIDDVFLTAPLTSYGTQKAICELLLNDYTRRGVVDGIGLRLPTICVRPGAPNKAASGFFSNIIREPLVGKPAVLPVSDSVRHWHASPRSAVGFLVHAATIDLARLGDRRSLSLPGVSVTVAEQIEALRKVAGETAVRLIRREPDVGIARIVENWPKAFDAQRAIDLGFVADRSFEDIIQAHIEDELGGRTNQG